MKYRNLKNWSDPSSSKNLLFFAQIFEELLFNFSLDTYKPSAMNSSLLCEEAIEVIAEIEEGNIRKPNLQHVLKELSRNLETDIVAKSLLDLGQAQLNSILLDPKKSSLEKKIVVELIQRQISLPKYKKQTETLLIDTINGFENFSNIRLLARTYATTLLNLGYSANYLYRLTLMYFYRKGKIDNNDAIRGFIEYFLMEPTTYRIIYRGSGLFREIIGSCHSFKIEILEDISSLGVDSTQYDFSLTNNDVYICASNIKALDLHSAKYGADSKIELITTLYALFHHKECLKVANDCLVISDEGGDIVKISKALNSMHKCIDHRPTKAAIKLNKLLSDFGLERVSFQKFTRSAELHSLALNSDSRENQMINLWIALESIIPSNLDENTSTIENMVNKILPFLNMVYYQKLVFRVAQDLLVWNKRAVVDSTRGISGNSFAQKLVKLASLDKYDEERTQLVNKFRDFHLMSDRFSYFCRVFSSPSGMKEGLDNHSQRIEWQIRRIYRARNLIVHSGKTPSYTDILIENIHDYLDIIMATIIKLASQKKEVVSIEQSFKYMKLLYDGYLVDLGKEGDCFSEEAIDKFFANNDARL